jgi:hypothetical protein
VLSALRVSGAFFAALIAVGACRRSFDERPVASLSSSPAVEEKFDTLRARWVDATPAGRAAMGPELNALMIDLEKKGDGLEPMARAYLAMSFLYGGVPAAAEATSRPLIDGPAGVANDLGTLVKGAAARRLGRPAEAVELLRPLIGKLIDPFARPLLYEEITESFLDQSRWDDAIVYAEGWLRSASGSEKKETRTAVARVLRRIPEAVALKVLEANAVAPPEAKHSNDLIVILAARVDEGAAIAAADAGATSDGGTVAAAEAGTPTVPLTPTIVPTFLPVRFDPRTIAVLVPSTAPGYATASTAVVRAAASVASPGLSLEADAGSSTLRHRLAVFDTGGTALGVTKALDAAEREGAGVVIGGVTEAESNALAAAAQTRRIAAVLLRTPSIVPKLPAGERQVWIAIGGTEADDTKATLAAATGDVAIVDPWPPPGSNPDNTDPLRARCDAVPKLAGATAFPIAAWRAKKVTAIVVLGDARCARKVADELLAGTPPYHPTLVLSPWALELAHANIALPRTVIGVGILPAGDTAPATLKHLWLDQASPVSFFNALGHDASTLAAAALPGDLPATTETAALQKARATTVTRLIAAKGELWTTTATSAGSSGLIAPVLSVRHVSSGAALKPSWVSP